MVIRIMIKVPELLGKYKQKQALWTGRIKIFLKILFPWETEEKMFKRSFKLQNFKINPNYFHQLYFSPIQIHSHPMVLWWSKDDRTDTWTTPYHT